MAGSALTQLKLSLRASGLSRTSNPKDPKKKSNQRKQLSSNSLTHRNNKLNKITNEFNKFDTKEENKKFQVVTRQGKLEEGKKGMPGKSRLAGLENRKKTLLPELEARNHTSTFLDRRFGETSTNLTPEEKALERFTAERRTSGSGAAERKLRFNLEDGPGGGGGSAGGDLTHGGRKLGFGDEDELEAGGWGGLGPSPSLSSSAPLASAASRFPERDEVPYGSTGGNRTPLLRRRMAEAAENGEEEAEGMPVRKRTKAEIMEEVVAKSKAYKYERQKTKSADDEVRLALDSELKDLRLLLGGGGTIPRPPSTTTSVPSTSTSSSRTSSSKALVDEEEEDEDEDEDDDEMDSDEDEDEDDDDEEEEGEGMNDEELEVALAGKSGVDRDLLRKLIGGGNSSDSDSDQSDSNEIELEPTSNSNFINTTTTRPPFKIPEEKDLDPYDSYVRLLALEPRAQASDRLKTPLELAKEAASSLKEREESRLRRQRGEIELDVDGGGGGEEGKGKKRKRVAQGDDLDDDFFEEEEGSEVDPEEGLGKGLEGGFGHQVIEDKSNEEEEEEEDDDDEEEEEEDEGESGDEMVIGGEEDEDENDFSESDEEILDTSAPEALVTSLPSTSSASTSKSRTWGGKDVKPELPFTFPCPSTHAEFANLLNQSGIKEEDTATVVKRIRVLYHPGLGEENKGKLQVFTNVLLDHVLHLASQATPTSFTTINSLLPPLLTLTHAFPLTSAPYYVEKLILMQKNFVRGLAKGPIEPTSKTWPGAPELTLLRLVGIVWSTSDLSHPVAAAALLLINQYLSQARIRSLSDISSGLFLCTLAGQFETLSKRLVPESINFLLNVLMILLPNSITSKSLPGAFPSPDLNQDHTKNLKLKSTSSTSSSTLELKPIKLNLGKSLMGKNSDNQLKVDLIGTCLILLKDLAEKYVSMEAFVELFKPTEIVLEKISNSIPSSIKLQIQDLQTSIQRMLKLSITSRKPLILQHHKPIPIATFIPKFDEGYNPNRKFDPDTERAEISKLKSLYKKEKKGAVRELRKDNRFLAGEEAKRKSIKDAEYTKKIAKIMGSLSDERHEEKLFERTKAKGKRQDKARAAK